MSNSTSGNYPPGAANDPFAPWNQDEPDPKIYDVTVSFSLSKPFSVTSDDDCDESIKQEIVENYKTPLDLINELKTRLQNELELNPNDKSIRKLIKECEEWDMDCDICID